MKPKKYKVRSGSKVKEYAGAWMASCALLAAREKGEPAKLYRRSGDRWRPWLPPFLREAL